MSIKGWGLEMRGEIEGQLGAGMRNMYSILGAGGNHSRVQSRGGP